MKSNHLKKLFLIDGFGAILSTFLWGIIIFKLQIYFGIPKIPLYILAGLPCIFAIYDFCVYYMVTENLAKYLKIIAIFNTVYCCLSLGIAYFNNNKLTVLGWLFIIIEVATIVIIAKIEFKAVNNFSKTNFSK